METPACRDFLTHFAYELDHETPITYYALRSLETIMLVLPGAGQHLVVVWWTITLYYTTLLLLSSSHYILHYATYTTILTLRSPHFAAPVNRVLHRHQYQISPPHWSP